LTLISAMVVSSGVKRTFFLSLAKVTSTLGQFRGPQSVPPARTRTCAH
jgi:hypothetical protein